MQGYRGERAGYNSPAESQGFGGRELNNSAPEEPPGMAGRQSPELLPQEGGDEDTRVQIEGGMPPAIRKIQDLQRRQKQGRGSCLPGPSLATQP